MNDKELKELQHIKKLLVLQLLAAGVPANEIARVIGMHKTDFSTLFPARRILKQIKKKSGKIGKQESD